MKERIEQERWYHDRLAEKDAEIERHKALHARAADALESLHHEWPVLGPPEPLIDELRKAAE